MDPAPRTLLRVDSSARIEGSHSRALADEIERRLRAEFPFGRVLRRDLAREAVPHLDEATIRAFYGLADPSSSPRTPGLARSDDWVAELEAADDLLISLPVYNFSVPSPLKAYIDHVVRAGRTFDVTATGFSGRLGGKRAFVAMSCGGTRETSGSDAVVALVETTLRFLGISSIATVVWSGTTLGEDELERGRERAMRRIDDLFATVAAPLWIGEFSARDREEIEALRAGQARAIERGDAADYAAACADDVAVMLPGHAPVVGRDELEAFEARIFAAAKFARFVKRPRRVERSGDLAYEIGDQEVEVESGDATGPRAARQKYLHVYRRTDRGWRFAALISNPDEVAS